MRIITTHPVEYMSSACGCHLSCEGSNGACNCHSSLDGSDNSKVREFQVWASMNKGARLSTDGIFGPLTKAAYDKWGAEWEGKQPKQTTTPTTKTVLRRGIVTAKKDGVNVYSVYDSKVLKTAKKGEYIGNYQGIKGDNAIYVNTTSGKAFVTKVLVDISEGPEAENKLTPEEKTISKMLSDGAKVSPETNDASKPTENNVKKGLWAGLPLAAKIGIIAGSALLVSAVVWKLLPKK